VIALQKLGEDPKFPKNLRPVGLLFTTGKRFEKVGLLYKLSKLEFSTSVIKFISPFLTERKFRVLVEGEISTLRHMQAGVPQGSVLSRTLYKLCMYVSCHLRISQRHASCVFPISNTNTEASKTVDVMTLILPDCQNQSS
jgi:hypothetical protein